MCELPLSILDPHRPEDAVFLSAILSHPDGNHWLADHYIDLYMHKDYINEPWEGFWDSNKLFACPFVLYNCISSAVLVETNIVLTDFLISLLQSGYYIYGSLNQSFIPQFSYIPFRSSHGTTIYGYDEKAEIFLLADFINGKYQKYTCNKENLENAIRYCNTEYLDNFDPYIGMDLLNAHLGTLNLLKVNKNVPYAFNKELLIESLDNYLNGKKPLGVDYIPYGRNTNQFHWGISVIDKCIELIQELNSINVKPIYLLKKHKDIMWQRMIYLRDNGIISETESYMAKNQELIQLYTQMYMMVVKYHHISWSSERCQKLVDLLRITRELELQNTEGILHQLLKL